MTSSPPVPRFSTASSSSCRASRAVTRSLSSSSSGIGGTLSDMARAYASVCKRPGTTRHSYEYRLIAVSSSLAHCLNHAAIPGRRTR